MVQAILTLIACVGMLILLMVADLDHEDESVQRGRIVHLALSIFGLFYQGVILAGSIQMVRGRSRGFAKGACILAVIPLTFFSQGLCLGFLLYPLALGAGIWGLIALSSNRASGPTYAAAQPTAAAMHSSASPSPYMSQANAGNSYSHDGSASRPLAAAKMAGGVVMIIGSLGIVFVIYQAFNEPEGDRPRRIGKAAFGAVALFTGGISLIAKGIADWRG